MAKKTKNIVGTVLSGFGIVAAVTVGIVANVLVFGTYSTTLGAALGDTGRRYTEVKYDYVDGFDSDYYKGELPNKEEREAYQKGVAEDICEEGMTLLQKGNMPYKADTTKISFFSESSVNFIYGGTGSGTASSDLTLKKVFEDEGFQVNDKLWNFYDSGKGKDYRRGSGSINYGDSDDYSINECPLDVILDENGMADSFKEYNTAAFVLSRTGGEGNDLARGMDDYVNTSKDKSSGHHPDADGDKRRSYLEPDSIELEIIDYLNKNFDDVIIIVNCNNAIELGWISDYENIGTVIQVPGTGTTGLQALPRILKGDVNPSGHLTDTYAFDAFSSPAMMNMGDFEFLTDDGTVNEDGIPTGRIPNYGMDGGSFNGYFYVNYLEGIYIGYRYYETRYADIVMGNGNAATLAEWEVGASKDAGLTSWDYSKEVQYPFGYGLSMTDFAWSEQSVEYNDETGDYIMTVKVTNTGNVAGKDVVQAYVQTPYGDYEKENLVEKSAVELVGFEKTKLLQPGDSDVVTISFNEEELASYNETKETYVLSGGTYYLTAAPDAHAAINNILRTASDGTVSNKLIASPSETSENVGQGYVYEFDRELDETTYKTDSYSGEEVENIFDFADISNYKGFEDVTYLTRNDWAGTYPKTFGKLSDFKSIHSARVNGENGELEGYAMYTKIGDDNTYLLEDDLDIKGESIYDLMRSYDSLNPAQDNLTAGESIIDWGNGTSEIELIDMRGRDIDDPLWEQLISKMTLAEATKLMENGGFKTESIESIVKPETSDKDGPAGLNNVSGHFPIGITYPCAIMIAQSWNRDLAEEKGNCIAEECLAQSISGWYGPGNNIHRTPFAGRNFEYYSEDPILASEIAEREVVGAAKKGVYAYIKHFALNDQEVHREKEAGITTWSNEQGIREIYLKAFEGVVKGDDIEERYYEIAMDENGNPIKDEKGNYQFTEKTTNIPSCTAIMTSFNRIGPVWAGGCYPLITKLLRNEWGFDGLACTDYYHFWFMDGEQSVWAGGSLMLDPEEHGWTIDDNETALKNQAFYSVRSLLYTIANSSAVDNYIHGTRELPRWKNYYTIMICVDTALVLLAAGLGVVCFLNVRKLLKKDDSVKVEEETNN